MDDDFINMQAAVKKRLNFLRRQKKMFAAGMFALFGMILIITNTVLFSALEWQLWSAPIDRTLMFGCIIISGGYFFVRAFFSILSIYFRPYHPSDIDIADKAGHVVPAVRDNLRNALQLLQDDSVVKNALSLELAKLAFTGIGEEFLRSDISVVVDRRPLKRLWKYAFLTLFLLPLYTISPMRDAALRIFHFSTYYHKPLPFTLEISPGNISVVEGDTLKLICQANGEAPAEVGFHFRRQGILVKEGEVKIVPMSRDSLFRQEIAGVMESFDYWAEAGRSRSPVYSVIVMKPPAVKTLRLELTPPAYSRLPKFKPDENIGDFIALAGTKVDLSVSSRGELSMAHIVLNSDTGNDSIAMSVSGNKASGKFIFMRAGSYYISLTAPDGLHNRAPLEYNMEILPDLPPVIDIVNPGADIEIMSAGGLQLIAEGEDDFGISSMELYWRNFSAFEPDTGVTFKTEPLKFSRDADGIFRAVFNWDLNWLLPGDIIEYYIRAGDNNNVSGPNYTDSKSYTITYPTMAEMYAAMEQSESEGLEKLEQTLKQSKEVKEEVEKAINEMRKKGDLDWSQKRQLDEKLKNQKEVLEKLEQAKESLDNLMQKAEESSLLSLELVQKYNELQKLLDDVASPELKKALQQLQDALQQADPEKLRQAAEMFQMSQDEMLKQMEKSLEILKQLQLERKLDELAERAQEIAERQNEIADSAGNKEQYDTKDLQRQEDILQSDMEDFNRKLDDTEQLAAEKDSATAAQLDSLSHQSESIPGEMQDMKGNMSKGKNQQAKQQGKQISAKLSQMSQKLSQTKKDMVQRKKDDLSEKLLAAVRDLVSISQMQEDLKKESAGLSPQSPKFREQASVQSGMAEGLEKVTQKMFELSQQSFFITPEIGMSLGQSASMMDAALSNYTNRSPMQASNQQGKAFESINRAAVQILDAIDKMQGSQSSTGFNEMMEQLQKMAGEQSGLNQQTQSMTMPMPGQSGNPSMPGMEGMGRLAAQQRALQRAMEELAQQAQQMQGIMGDLGQAAEQMGEAADSLEDRNVGDRTLKLQERILSRLLDAQKSVRTQKTSKERESRAGIDVSRRSPGDIQPDDYEEQLRRDLMKAMKEGYSPDYQRLIREYYRVIYQKTGKQAAK